MGYAKYLFDTARAQNTPGVSPSNAVLCPVCFTETAGVLTTRSLAESLNSKSFDIESGLSDLPCIPLELSQEAVDAGITANYEVKQGDMLGSSQDVYSKNKLPQSCSCRDNALQIGLASLCEITGAKIERLSKDLGNLSESRQRVCKPGAGGVAFSSHREQEDYSTQGYGRAMRAGERHNGNHHLLTHESAGVLTPFLSAPRPELEHADDGNGINGIVVTAILDLVHPHHLQGSPPTGQCHT